MPKQKLTLPQVGRNLKKFAKIARRELTPTLSFFAFGNGTIIFNKQTKNVLGTYDDVRDFLKIENVGSLVKESKKNRNGYILVDSKVFYISFVDWSPKLEELAVHISKFNKPVEQWSDWEYFDFSVTIFGLDIFKIDEFK